jgi:hypothetical protein
MKTLSPLQEGLRAARANALPGLAIQGAALTLALAYFFIPSAHAQLDTLAAWKASGGLLSSAISTAFFGGLLPYLILIASPKTRKRTPLSHGLFYLVFWAYKGVEVDTFYQLQGWLFGPDSSVKVVFLRVCVDQFLYTAFWSAPISLLLFHWKEQGFPLKVPAHLSMPSLLTTLIRQRLPVAVISTWGVWIPTLAIVYSLPSPLHFPLFNLVLCFYVLLFNTVTARKTESGKG